MNETNPEAPFPITNIAQICVIVPDLDRAVENYWKVFGIGPGAFTPTASHWSSE